MDEGISDDKRQGLPKAGKSLLAVRMIDVRLGGAIHARV
jgi:hypothetical protein